MTVLEVTKSLLQKWSFNFNLRVRELTGVSLVLLRMRKDLYYLARSFESLLRMLLPHRCRSRGRREAKLEPD